MRTLIVTSLGLICVGFLAGCGLFQDSRCNCGSGQCNGSTPKHIFPRAQTKTNGAVASSKDGTKKTLLASNKSTKTISVSKDSRIPIESQPIKGDAPDVLPDVPTLPASGNSGEKDPGVESVKIEIVPLLNVNMESNVSVPVTPTTPSAPTTTIHSPMPQGAPMAQAAPMPQLPKNDQVVAVKSVHIKFGHGDNYENVTGQVQSFRKTLRLRYASVEQEDRYGGVVLLEGDLAQLRDGQHVRLQGTIIPSGDRGGQAKYRVTAVEVLD